MSNNIVREDQNNTKQALYFSAGALSVGVLLYFAATNLNSLGFLSFVAVHFSLSMLVVFAGVYTSVQKKTHDFLIYHPKGWIHRLFSGLWLIYIKWIFVSFPFIFYALIRLSLFRAEDWVFFYSIFVLFFGVSFTIGKITRSQTSTLFRISSAITISKNVFPYIVALLMVPVLLIIGPEGVSSAPAEINFDNDGTAIANLSVWGYSQYELIENWAVNTVFGAVLVPVITFIELLALSYIAYMILSFFLIPLPELRRAVRPISGDLSLPPLSGVELMKISAITVVLSIFVYFQTLAGLETYLSNSDAYYEFKVSPDGLAHVLVEKAFDEYYEYGTSEKLATLTAQELQRELQSQELMAETIELALSEIENNVDLFLDAYYTVSAEWMRLYKTLITRNAEEYLAAKVEEYITSSEEYARIDGQLEILFRLDEESRLQYQERVNQILFENRIDEPTGPYVVTKELNFRPLSIPDSGMDSSLTERTVLSAASAVITAKVTSKLIVKASFKVAAQFFIKVAGGAAGATAGGAIGTAIVPVIGTVIGIGVGGLVGYGFDRYQIKKEEKEHRDDFKQDILDSITESRYELLNQQ